ncbi:MAG: hypothetical protein ACOX3D_09030 [Syntrophomonadales bacterium]|jgi:hypothetical protein
MSIIKKVAVLGGDLGGLTPQERGDYYVEVCDSVGVNPLTEPFKYITLNGKLQLYATRACAEQLRKIHNISRYRQDFFANLNLTAWKPT